jgi:DNA repair photolyase
VEGAMLRSGTTKGKVADGTNRKEGRLRLSDEYVKCILSRKPIFVVDPDEEYARMVNHPDKIYSQEFIEESVELFRDQAESSKRNFASFEKLQAWMRSELEEKGYVEVDDAYIAQRVLCRVAPKLGVEEWVDAFGYMEGFEAYTPTTDR